MEVNKCKPKVLDCLRCGHKWISRVKRKPKTCCHCHSDKWNVIEWAPAKVRDNRAAPVIQKCLRCKKTWYSRKIAKRCTHCHTNNWNVKGVGKGKRLCIHCGGVT